MNSDKQARVYFDAFNYCVFNEVPHNSKVLDIGCNVGNIGARLQAERACIVYGVDCSEEALSVARSRLTKVAVLDLETGVMPFPGEIFDVVIFSDVLEHIRFPDVVLRQFVSCLSPAGIVIASIPNVANIHIRLELMFGNWNLRDIGILDRSHLRFFTEKTIRELFCKSGYEILRIGSMPGFNFLVLRHYSFLKRARERLCRLYPRLFAKQFIVVARKCRSNSQDELG